jgi:hypothetical protein
MRNQLDNGLKRRKRLATPIDGNVRKEPMLDLVPFAGGRRQVANGDGQAGLISQMVHLLLPQQIAYPIGATPISYDQQFPTSGIQFAAHALPPASDAFDRKRCGLMIDPDVDEAAVVHQIIDAIRNGFLVRNGRVIIDIHGRLLSFGLPFSPAVLESADQLFLLTINGNDWLAFGFKSFTGSIDVLKLGIAVGMRCSLKALLGGFEGKAPLGQHPSNSCLPNRIPLTSEGFPQFAHRFACPSDQALWISFRVQHPFQIGSQGGILDDILFPAPTLLAYPLPRLIERSCL